MNQDNPEITFEETVRMRPHMFIGNEGLIGLFTGLITNCIGLCETEEFYFEITILGNNDFSFGISSKHNLSRFLKQFTAERSITEYYFPKVLKAISKKFKIIINHLKTEINFSIDNNVISETSVDYIKLSEKVFQLAILNRKTEILAIDKSQKHISQNYYHFPQGIFYLSDREINEASGKPEFILRFDGEVNSNTYQILLAYRTDWYPSSQVLSFSNNMHTRNSSLVNGIMEGLILACRTHVREQKLVTHKIKQKKFLNGLILICSVRGNQCLIGADLENDEIKIEAKKIIHTLALDFFRNEKAKGDTFLWRFDSTQLTSGMY